MTYDANLQDFPYQMSKLAHCKTKETDIKHGQREGPKSKLNFSVT